MRTLHIIMPMAGEGSRFRKEGWTIPKPLIAIKGEHLFFRAIKSIIFDDLIDIKYSFIVREEHIINYKIDYQIKKQIPNASIFSIIETTRGAVETCLYAENNIDDNDAIIVMDCDLEFKSNEYNKFIKSSLNCDINSPLGGVLLSFESELPKYSYAEIDQNGNVIKTAEKEVISNNALCGAYFFHSGKDFKDVAHELLNDNRFNKPEFYVSLLYNYLIKKGKTIKLAKIDKYYSYGTPEEISKYL